MMGTHTSYALKEKNWMCLPHVKRLFWHLSAEGALWIPAPQLLTLPFREACKFQENELGFQRFLSPAFTLVQPGSHDNPGATKSLSSVRLRNGLRPVHPTPKGEALQVAHIDLDWCCTASLSQLVLVGLLMETSENAYESFPQLAMGLSQQEMDLQNQHRSTLSLNSSDVFHVQLFLSHWSAKLGCKPNSPVLMDIQLQHLTLTLGVFTGVISYIFHNVGEKKKKLNVCFNAPNKWHCVILLKSFFPWGIGWVKIFPVISQTFLKSQQI